MSDRHPGLVICKSAAPQQLRLLDRREASAVLSTITDWQYDFDFTDA
jgi:hypothetical protein